MRPFRKNREKDPTEHTDPRLVDAVRALGRQWGATPVALTAAYLSNPQLIRNLISAEVRHVSFDESNRELAERFADQEGTRCGAIDEVAETLDDQPPGIEEDTTDLPLVTHAAARVGEYLSSWGDGLVDKTTDGKPLYARDLEALRQHVIHESAGILPSGRPWPPKPNLQAALIRAGHRIAELEGALNAVHALAFVDDDSEFWEPVHRSSTRSRMLEIREITASTGGVRRTGKDGDRSHDDES